MTGYALDKSLALLREQGLQAAEMRSTDAFRRIVRRHVELLSTYFHARSSFRPVLHHQQPTMIALLGYESRPLFAICSSIEELIRKAFSVLGEDLAVTATYGVTDALGVALDNESLEIFRRLLQLIEVAFVSALCLDVAQKRYDLLLRISRSQEEFARYKLTGEKFGQRTRPLKLPDFGAALVQSQQAALKLALDRKDIRAFNIVADAAKGLLHPGVDNLENDLMTVQIRLRNPALDEPTRRQLETQLARLEADLSFFRSVSETKNTMFYGLAAWAINMYQSGSLSPEQAQEIFGSLLPLFGDFTRFTELYIAIVRKNREPLGWTFWTHPPTEGIGVGPVSYGGDSSWVDRFYVLGALKLIPETPRTEEVYKILSDQGAGSIGAIAGEVRRLGTEVAAHPEKWAILIPELGTRPVTETNDQLLPTIRFERLYSFWDTLVNQRRLDEEKSLLAAEVTPETVQAFSDEVKKAWLGNSVFRQLEPRYSFLEDHLRHDPVPETVKFSGVNQLELKEWFVSGRDYSFRSIAEHLGKGLAQFETEETFRRISMTLNRISCASPNEARERLDSYIDSVGTDRVNSHVILCTFAYEYDLELHSSPEFKPNEATPARKLNVNGYRGEYRTIPVIAIWLPGQPELRAAVCVDLHSAGIWRQYWSGEIGQNLQVRVDTIDELRAMDLLNSNPALGLGTSDEVLDKRAAILRLRKDVHIRILERFEYITLDGAAGLVIEWQRPDNLSF